MSHLVDERPVAPGQAGQAGGADQAGTGGQLHWYRWILPAALILAVVAGAVGLASGVADRNPAVRSPAARPAAPTDAGPAVVRVLSSTGQVRAGPGFPAVNGITYGLGSLWLTGGGAGQNHLLYALDPVTSRINGRVALPSRLVMNPGDVATGSGAAWVAVGASVYRVGPARALAGGAVAHAFATLPQGGIVGDLAVDAGAVWATDMTNGKVYRFAASTGRLEAVVTVGATAGAMAVGDGGVWIADADAHTVSRISVTSNRVDSVLTVPGAPSHIAASASGLWVTDGTDGVVTDLDGAAGRAVTVRVGREPTGLAAIGNTVWVANTADGTLSRIDARRHVFVATVTVGTRPYAVAADRRSVWVALLGTPVMMHTSPAPSASTGPWARLRVCGGGYTDGPIASIHMADLAKPGSRRWRRARSIPGALAGMALLAMAALPGCSSSAGPQARSAGPPARILMVRDYALRAVLAQDKQLGGTFANRQTYVIGVDRPVVPRLTGTVEATAVYTSYAAFAADIAAGRLPGSYRAVLYDIEKWAATPLAEQQNPHAYMVRFSDLARAHGLLPILAPARDLALVPGGSCEKRTGENLNQAYIRCGLAGADAHAAVLVVQSQVNQPDVPAFRHFLVQAVRQARAGNPGVTVLAQLATAPLGREASLAELVAAARSVGGLVQGFSLNVRVTDIDTAVGLLRSFR